MSVNLSRILRSGACIGAFLVLGAADSCDRPPPDTEAGRYWARVGAYGVALSDGTMWIEYRPSTLTSWGFVPRTPPRSVVANQRVDGIDEWLSGLAPATVYEYRICFANTAGAASCDETEPAYSFETAAGTTLRRIEIDPASPRHLRFDTGARVTMWGNNYVGVTGTGDLNSLVEDVMYTEIGRGLIADDLDRLKNLGPPTGQSNSIRLHVQFHEFLVDPVTPNRPALARLAQTIELAEDRGLYVMLCGLNYFYPAENPAWVANQTEAERWASQALWWQSVAGALAHSPGVFAYDLMNEPYATGGGVLPDGRSRFTTVGPDDYCDFGEDLDLGRHGLCFGQYLTATPGTRTAVEISAAWTQKMVHAIRYAGYFPNDPDHLITVGAGAFGMANPFNSAPAVHQHLDFLSPHLYPDTATGQDAIDLAAAMAAISTKPIIAGETFPFGPADRLISRACNAGTVQGWFGQYDGRVLGDPCLTGNCILHDAWYILLRDWSPIMLANACPPLVP